MHTSVSQQQCPTRSHGREVPKLGQKQPTELSNKRHSWERDAITSPRRVQCRTLNKRAATPHANHRECAHKGSTRTDTTLHRTATYLRWLLHHGLEVAHQPQPGRCCRGAAHLDEHPTTPVQRWRREREAAQDGCPTANTVRRKRERSNSSAPNGVHPALQRRAGRGARAGKSTQRGRAPPQHTPAQHLCNRRLTTGVGCATHERGGNGPGRGDAGRRRGRCLARGRGGHRGRGRHEWEAPRGDGGQPASVPGGGVRRSVGRVLQGRGGDVPLHSASDWFRRGGWQRFVLPHPRVQGGHDAAWAGPAAENRCFSFAFCGRHEHNCSQIGRRGTSDRGRQ